MDFTGLYRVLPGFIVAAFSSVVHPSPKLAQFLDRVLPGFTGFYRVFFCTEQDFLLRVGVDGRTTDERRSIGVPIGRRRKRRPMVAGDPIAAIPFFVLFLFMESFQ